MAGGRREGLFDEEFAGLYGTSEVL
jgi:hypothetical protein